jgi:hemolysin activation/secretion protein
MQKVTFGAFVSAALTFGVAAQAQNYQEVAPRAVPAPAAPAPAIAPALPAPSDDRRVALAALKGLVFVGAVDRVKRQGIADNATSVDPTDLALLKDEAFLAAMRIYIGKPLTFADVNEITRTVIQRYRELDHPVVDVVVPEQDIDSGIVQFAVVEPAIGAVRAEGNKFFATETLVDRVRAKPGDPIVGSRLLQDVAALNENPFRRIDLVYERDQEPGLTDIVLRTEDRFPLRVYGGFDNFGTASLGRERVLAGFNYGNLFGLDQQLSYQFTGSSDLITGNPSIQGRPDQARFTAHSVTYTVPLSWGDRLTVFGTHAESLPRLANTFNQLGLSDQVSFRYAIPLARSESGFHEVRIGYDFKSSNNNLEFGGSSVSKGVSEIHQAVLEYSGLLQDRFGTTAPAASLFVSPGGLSRDNSTQAFQIGGGGRAGATADYVYGQIGLDRNTPLPAKTSWWAHGVVQRSDASLLASEQFGVGGVGTVRGYDQYAVEGDNGWLLSNELRSPSYRLSPMLGLASVEDQLQLFTFYDIGHVDSRTFQAGQPQSKTLAGTGVGFRYSLDRYVDLKFDYAVALQPLATATSGSSRFDVALTIGY